MTASVHTKMLRLGGRPVRVVTHGEGRPLLLLNGIGAPVEIWRPLLPHLGNMRAIAFDAPGSGATPAGQWPLSIRGHARLALDVLDELECAQTAVLGFSFGGLVAQELAHGARSRVDRLVLASTSYGWGSIPGSLPALLNLGSPDRYPSSTAVAAAATGNRRREGLPATAPPAASPAADRRGRFFQAAAAVSWSSAWWLWQVRQPALIITGDLDAVVPGVNSAILAALLPAGRLHVVRGGGHLCILEQAAELGPILRSFLLSGLPTGGVPRVGSFLGAPVRPRTGPHRIG
jgi:poly(3-hydroxyoctanoate) depolymerase